MTVASRVVRAAVVTASLSAPVLVSVGVAHANASGPSIPAAYYVAKTGSDDAGDGSQLHPWRTIGKATATAPAGATVLVAAGRYGPFEVTRVSQTVSALPDQRVVVRGRAGVADVVKIAADAVTVEGLTVTHCVPNPEPPGSFEDGGSSAVRIDDHTVGVTLRDLTITRSAGTNGYGHPFGCYGVFAHRATAFHVLDSDISGTGTGVYVNGAGESAVISGNQIHDNTVLVRDTPGGDDDYGAVGVFLSNVRALPGVLATGNHVFGNAGPSEDYGQDGGGFELFNASHTQIVDNVIANNDDVLETGSLPGGGGRCAGNLFSANRAKGRTVGSTLGASRGLLLRCATRMLVEDNRFTRVDQWVYDIETRGRFATNVNGLVLTGNTQHQKDPVYHLAVDPDAARLVLQSNAFTGTGPVFATYADGSSSPDLAAWQQRTGQDLAPAPPRT